MFRPVGESVPGYVGGGWSGVGAPANTPNEIIDLLNREVNAALADPTIKGRLENMGSPVLMMSPAEFRKLTAEETERWPQADLSCHAALSWSIALSVVIIFRMTATMMTLVLCRHRGGDWRRP